MNNAAAPLVMRTAYQTAAIYFGDTPLVAPIRWTPPRSVSAEEDLSLGHPLRWDRLERPHRFGQRDPDDVGAVQRDHHAEVLVVHRVSGVQAEPGRQHTVVCRGHSAALQVPQDLSLIHISEPTRQAEIS